MSTWRSPFRWLHQKYKTVSGALSQKLESDSSNFITQRMLYNPDHFVCFKNLDFPQRYYSLFEQTHKLIEYRYKQTFFRMTWHLSAMAMTIAMLTFSTIANVAQADESTNQNATNQKVGRELFFFNWSDYIDPQVLKDFEAETGIKVHYSLMDSNEMLEAKMIAGRSGYDVIAPSLHVLKRLADLKLLMPLNKEQLPNLSHLDPLKMEKIAKVDIGNTYGIPYMELSTAIAYNEQKVKQVMGSNFTIDSWDVLFKPELVSKLSSCGVTALDSASDMLCTALIYMGKDPESTNKQDYADAGKLIRNIGKHLAYFHSSQYVNDLASGEICMAVSWAGDAQIANQRAQEAGLDKIVYVIPKEGALMGYDMLAIPHDAPNPENAHIFLNYLMRPEVIAKISNYIRYANANKDATPLVDKEITSNLGIYYDAETLKRLHIVVPPIRMERLMTKEWNKTVTSAGNK